MNQTIALALIGLASSVSVAGVSSFVEDFNDGASNWADGIGSSLVEVGSGALDGSAYVSTTTDLNTAGPFGLTLFRGQDGFDSSGDAFVGDYIAGGITTISFDVRHNAGMDLDIAVRLASSFNFPAIGIQSGTLVSSGVWTTLTFAIDPSNPLLVVEPPFTPADYETILSSIGNIQVSSFRPDGLSTPLEVTFDLDNVTITPAPSAVALLGLGGLAMGRRRR